MTKKNTNLHHRIVFVLPSFTAGGAERVLITLMNDLDATQFHKELVVLRDEGPLRQLVDSEISVSVCGKKVRLLQILKMRQPDIIVSTMAPLNFMLLLLKRFLPGARFIVREAITPSFFFNKGGWKARVSHWGYRFLYPKADVILSPSQKIIDELQDIIGVQNYELLPNPVDVERIRQKVKEAAPPIKERCVRFLCSGRLGTQKGFDRLIAALPSLKMKSDYDWELVILGEGEERQALESLIVHHNLQGKITLAGHLENPWATMAQADCFLLPSRWEGLPNVVLESLACGTPVIAMKEAGGIAEIAKHTKGRDLVIVETIEKMIEEMRKLEPGEESSYPRESLLPERFYKDRVIKKFTKIILESA